MTKPLTKEELIRSDWIVKLRSEGDRQCFGAGRRGNSVCALALLNEAAQINVEWFDIDNYRSAGLGLEQAEEIIALNDGSWSEMMLRTHRKHTFSEIADVVEGWFRNANEGVGAVASRITKANVK
jgi:hypothetical protein